jgi:hypothetical protein
MIIAQPSVAEGGSVNGLESAFAVDLRRLSAAPRFLSYKLDIQC